jgi:hypothetical protein
MDVSPNDARESLSLIDETATRTRKAISASYAGNLLILWGLIWVAGFTAVHFLHGRGGLAFAILDGVGVAGTLLIGRKWPIRDAVRGPGARQTARGILIFWFVLVAYAGLWIALLRPATGVLLGTFLATTMMLGYVVTGLWSSSRFLVWLGLIVTALTLFGYYIIPGYFNLWMAPMGGGALMGTGLYVRLRWR